MATHNVRMMTVDETHGFLTVGNTPNNRVTGDNSNRPTLRRVLGSVTYVRLEPISQVRE